MMLKKHRLYPSLISILFAFDYGLYAQASDSIPSFQANINKIYDYNNGSYTCVGWVADSLEEDVSNVTGLPVTQNAVFTVPVQKITKPTKPLGCPEVGAFWYNDFGLESTRSRIGPPFYATSIWYDWGWNWKSGAGGYEYCPDRHPMIGWYHGDDSITLAYQVKWLLQFGVDFVICQNPGIYGGLLPDDNGNWNSPQSVCHWLYHLLNHVPNVGGNNGLKFSFWLPSGSTSGKFKASSGYWNKDTIYSSGETVINTAYDNKMYSALTTNTGKPPHLNGMDWAPVPMPKEWSDFADFYSKWPEHVQRLTRNGKTYPVCFFWECNVLSANIGMGTFKFWMQELGAKFNTLNSNWEGAAVIGNYSPTPSLADGISYSPGGQLDYDTLEKKRCVLIRGDYNGTSASHGSSLTATKNEEDRDEYQDLINLFPSFYSYRAYAESRRAFGVPTAQMTVPPHSSGFAYKGHSPSNFQTMMLKILSHYKTLASAGKTIPIITIYNVAEWAEGGPGLQPNKQDGFAYLQALKDAMDAYASLNVKKEGGARSNSRQQDTWLHIIPHLSDPGCRLLVTMPLHKSAVLTLFGIDGKHIRSWQLQAGAAPKAIEWNGTSDRGAHVPSGFYFCRLKNRDSYYIKRFMLLE